jgi:hypothetical protein
LIRRHGRALEADLAATYPGVRLRHVYTGEMTWRELASYVQGLPPDSRVRTALNGGRPEATGEQVLLADVFDMLQRVNWTLQAVNATKESKAPKPPKPYPRWWLASGAAKVPDEQRRHRLERARERARDRKRQLREGAIA